MIQSATFKLTLWYLGIIMVLSVLFSAALYNESTSQLDAGVGNQRASIARLPLPREFEPRRTAFLEDLDAQLSDAHQKILLRLVALNMLTLALGGAASYMLARRTLRPIEDALEAQGRFTADASHELRTPLTAMRTEIEVSLRQKELSSTEARELLTSNLEEIAKLESLSAGLLRLARSDGGLDPAAVTEVPVTEIFSEATRRFQVLINQRDVTLDVTAGDETVSGDRDSLIELIALLLDNAIKYSPTGSSIALTSQASGGFVRLAVADHGIGIAASDLPHIFDRFYRADRSRSKDKIEGYGLGLSIVKRIVDLHQGTIHAESEPDKGTTFRIKLPTHHAPKKAQALLAA